MTTGAEGNAGAAPASTGAPAGGAPAAAAPAAAASNGGAQQTPAPVAGEKPAATPGAEGYKVPDAYKDKPWAKNVKSEEELWKQFDGLQAAVGKKGLIVPDFDKATPEQIEEFLATTRPSDKSAYKFAEGSDEGFVGEVADIFHKNGVSAYQGNKIIEAYNVLETKNLQQQTSADGFKEVMTKSFGDKYEGDVKAVVAEHTKHLSPEDKALVEAIPNQYLGVLYRLTRSMQKAYGAAENGAAHTEGGTTTPQGVDVNVQRSELRKQIRDMDAKPHTAADRQKLVDQLQATYSNSKGK